jgi:RNA polymerase sigma-B factor
MLAVLPEREQTIVYLRFFEGLTQSEIAERIGISQMHVSRLLARSLETLGEHATTTVER